MDNNECANEEMGDKQDPQFNIDEDNYDQLLQGDDDGSSTSDLLFGRKIFFGVWYNRK